MHRVKFDHRLALLFNLLIGSVSRLNVLLGQGLLQDLVALGVLKGGVNH